MIINLLTKNIPLFKKLHSLKKFVKIICFFLSIKLSFERTFSEGKSASWRSRVCDEGKSASWRSQICNQIPIIKIVGRLCKSIEVERHWRIVSVCICSVGRVISQATHNKILSCKVVVSSFKSWVLR